MVIYIISGVLGIFVQFVMKKIKVSLRKSWRVRNENSNRFTYFYFNSNKFHFIIKMEDATN